MKSVQTSSYRDRTHEFSSITERLRKSLAPSIGVNGSGGVGGSRSSIGYGIHHTSQKLAKLAKLAKRTSVFDDPTKEIQELTAVIKQDITALNSAVVDLQLICNSQNESENVSSDTTTHSTTVVDNLKNRLMSTTKEFKGCSYHADRGCADNLKVHENRRQLFSATTSKETANPFIRQRPLANKSTASASSSSSPPPWANDSSSSSPLFQSFLDLSEGNNIS
ncbi:hypothetical protein Hdeb2414_s0106g00795771 [Helianthus debilis subsp. tardiflorus]